MNFLISALFLVSVSNMVLANAAPRSESEIYCKINAKFIKDTTTPNSAIDLRFVYLPVLNKSGTSIQLKPDGQTLNCQKNYVGVLDENIYISVCADQKEEGPLKIDKIEITLLRPKPNENPRLFCKPNSDFSIDEIQAQTK